LSPDQIRRFPDSSLFDQLARHRAHQVFVGIERHQAFARELTLQHQRNEHLFAHQPQAGLLHCPGIGDELHPHRITLADAPRAPAGLPQRV
jgi:hypothetical protein